MTDRDPTPSWLKRCLSIMPLSAALLACVALLALAVL